MSTSNTSNTTSTTTTTTSTTTTSSATISSTTPTPTTTLNLPSLFDTDISYIIRFIISNILRSDYFTYRYNISNFSNNYDSKCKEYIVKYINNSKFLNINSNNSINSFNKKKEKEKEKEKEIEKNNSNDTIKDKIEPSSPKLSSSPSPLIIEDEYLDITAFNILIKSLKLYLYNMCLDVYDLFHYFIINICYNEEQFNFMKSLLKNIKFDDLKPSIFITNNTTLIKSIIHGSIEKILFDRVGSSLFEIIINLNHARDIKVNQTITNLKSAQPNDFGIGFDISKYPELSNFHDDSTLIVGFVPKDTITSGINPEYESRDNFYNHFLLSIEKFRNITGIYSPREKLKQLIDMSISLSDLTSSCIGTDDLCTLLSYIIVIGSIPNIVSELVYTMIFVDEYSLEHANGFILATIVGLLNFITTLGWKNIGLNDYELKVLTSSPGTTFIDFNPSETCGFYNFTQLCDPSFNCNICNTYLKNKFNLENNLITPKSTNKTRKSSPLVRSPTSFRKTRSFQNMLPTRPKTNDINSKSRVSGENDNIRTILSRSQSDTLNDGSYAIWFQNAPVIKDNYKK